MAETHPSGLNPDFDFKALLDETMSHVSPGESSQLDPRPQGDDPSSKISAPASLTEQELQESTLVPIGAAAANRAFDFQTTDETTKLRKGEFFKAQLEHMIGGMKEGDDLAVTIFDVDNFKTVNDVMGHDKGDELLGIIGAAYQEIYRRKTDTLGRGNRSDGDNTARLHGDEFGAVIVHDQKTTGRDRSNSAKREAESQATRLNLLLQQRLKDTLFQRFNIRLSQGTAELQAGDTAETLIFKADIAMLTNKYEGKEADLSSDDKAWINDPYNSEMIRKLGLRVPDWLATHITKPEDTSRTA